MNPRSFLCSLAALALLAGAAAAQIRPDAAVQISLTGVPQTTAVDERSLFLSAAYRVRF